MDNQNIFWQASSRDLKKGYIRDKDTNEYICLICGKKYKRGIIYTIDKKQFTAKLAVKTHITAEHGSMFNYLLNMGKIYNSLTEKQRELMQMFFDGLSDKEITKRTGATNTSTIRNQRFAFKEKYKQAKITVALYELLEEGKHSHSGSNATDTETFVDFHRTAMRIDERFAITEAERDEVLNRYFDMDNNLVIKNFPAKEKKKIIILQRIMESFETDREYSEKEVNLIIKGFYDDIPSIRRCLIEYGFLDRTADGSNYWVKR